MNARETMHALMTGRTVRAMNDKYYGRMYMLSPEGSLLVLMENGDIKPSVSIDLSIPYEVVEDESDAQTVIMHLLDGGTVRHKDMRYWIDGNLLRKQWRGERPITLADFSKNWEVLPDEDDEETHCGRDDE